MAYSSFSFDPAQIEINKSAASDAQSAAVAANTAALAAQSKASDASSAVAAISDAASNALSKATYVSQHTASAIYSNPGIGSRVIKEFIRTSAGLVKARYSTAAQA